MPGEPEHAKLVQAMKDLQEFWFIVHSIGDRLLEPAYLAVLGRAVSDAVLPDPDRNDSPGRDAQFELLLAAFGEQASLVVEPGTGRGPDLIISSPARKCAVEVKRIKNFDRMPSRVSAAADQIKASGLGGIIAIDISMALGPEEHQVAPGTTDEQIQEAQTRRGRDFKLRHLPVLAERVRGRSVGLIVVHDYVLRPSATSATMSQPWALNSLWDRFSLVPPGTDLYRHFDEMWSMLSVAMPQL